MTMLDRMRRHKGWLKWSLALVVLTFVVFYIPDFLTTSTGAAPSEVLAEVEGEPITVGAFTRRYNAQVNAYRNAYGGQINDQLIKQLGIDRQILTQLVDEEAMVAESRKQGFTVSDVEIRERILALPGFQENGRFIGEQRYRQLLQFQNPPMTTAEFERSLRRALQIEKLRNALTGWMSVSDAEVAAEFRKRNEKVKLDVVPVTAAGVQESGHRHRRGNRRGVREIEGAVSHRREAQDQVRAAQRRAGAPDDRRAGDRNRGVLSAEPFAIPDAGASPREPHPVQARRQGREGRSSHGGRRAQESQGSGRGLRGARQAVLGRRLEQRQRRRPRLLRPRPHGCRVRTGRVRDEERRDQQPGQDGVRLPHHQDGGQQAGDDASDRGSAHRDRRSAEVAEGAGRSREARQDAGIDDQDAGRSRPHRERAQAWRSPKRA